MRDNRFSVAPSKSSSNNNNIKNNINSQSNIKTGNDSKNRKSSNPMMFPRSTTFSSLSKSSDPRPIKENHFHDECITKVLDFMIKEYYDKAISKKDLVSPGAKDFMNLFIFVIGKIRPDWNLVINKLDEDVIPILNELRYPGYITKSHLVAVGAPNTWPHLLAVLAWLVELASYLILDNNLEKEEGLIVEKLNLNNLIYNNSNSNNWVPLQEKIFEQNYKEFLYDGYKQSLNKGDSFSAVESFQKKTEELVKLNYTCADKLIKEISHFEKLTDDLEQNYPTLNETKFKLDVISRELNNLKSSFFTQEKKFNELALTKENRIKIYESKCEKNKEYMKTIEELETIVKNQKLSFDDFEKLKHNKNLLEKQMQGLNIKKQEVSDLIWRTKNNIENFTNILNEKIKSTNLISDKLQLNKENLIYAISNNINNSNNDILDLDMNEVSSNFNGIYSTILNYNNVKNIEVKEKENLLINQKSDLLKLEDRINETKEVELQKKADHERENEILISEKEKYSMIINQRNEEIKRINDNFQKMVSIISEKEKEFDEVKQREVILNTKYLEEEEAADIFLKDLENEYVETYNEIEKMKNENIRELRKANCKVNEMFENIKNNFPSNYDSNINNSNSNNN